MQHKFINPQQPLLADDKVRHVGEAVAVIVAENRDAAEDAAQLVTLDLEPLPPVLDPDARVATGHIVHDILDQPDRRLYSRQRRRRAVLKRAPRRLERRFYHHRYAAPPMECRGVVGLHDGRTDTVTIWSATQVVHWVRREAAAVLRLPEAKSAASRSTSAAALASRPCLSGGPVDPLSGAPDRPAGEMDRGPPRAYFVRLPFARPDPRRRGRLRRRRTDPGLRDHFAVDCGAWNPIGAGIAYNTAVHLPGPYKIGAIAISGRIARPTSAECAYRGAGRPERRSPRSG